ncbi:hypothetical protein [Zobellia laminariae]|uniref:hypothetical protein n=1 Tax=Zobellia laminariae TaxID=248906 RepID=UPI0026F46AB1|nr:hypothetical protein [Zobellia laminariae]WKX76169.1 hypothetical protein Q5W13_21800 [Zobellia laminariae]
MCTNCKSFAQKQADAIGKDIVITDPDGTKIFRPWRKQSNRLRLGLKSNYNE